jgi:competence protein ComEC
VVAGFFAGGSLLAADAWREAWRPPLRLAFEQAARAERDEADGRGAQAGDDDGAAVVLVGLLRTDAARGPGGVSLSLTVVSMCTPGAGTYTANAPCDEQAVAGGVLLTVAGILSADRMDAWRAGRTIRAPVRLRRPSRYLNPGVPDLELALARRGTTLVGSVKSGALVELVARGHPLAEAAASVRAFVRRAIADGVGRWSPRSAAIVTAIVIGDRTGLDGETERQLQEAGTYHVIAISGGNIAILSGLTIVMFRVAGLLGSTAMVTAAAGLTAYGFVVGGGASVARATLMAVVYFAGRAADLRGPPANTLAVAAGFLVAVDPLAVVDPGFLLTFGATASIVGVAPFVPVRTLPVAVALLVSLLAATAAAEAALLPVTAFFFSRVTFAGLVLNFAAVPLMAVVQVAGMATVPAVVLSSSLGAAVGWLAHAAAEGLVRSAGLVAYAPAVGWRVAAPGWLALGGYYSGLAVAWALWRARERTGSAEPPPLAWTRRGAAGAAVLALVWMLAEPWTWIRARGDGRLHVTFIDVGQGDAALVRFPRGATLLVDAGGLPEGSTFDVGDRVVAPVLRHAGVRRLSFLAITHGDADHAAGASAIVREFRPLAVWEGIPVPSHQPLNALRTMANHVRASWANVQAGDAVTVDEVRALVRHPALADWERQEVRNDDSIVLELAWRDVSIVLTGDIGRDVERAIAPSFPRARLRIVKMPHHGSLTSSSRDFVEELAPRVAVASAGRSNPFGHPSAAVLDRYGKVGADVYRTDRDGAVTITTDGRQLEVRTFTGERRRYE